MHLNKIGEISGKNILLLQGPMGGFFKRLDTLFRQKGAHTLRIGFNLGDAFFSFRDNYIAYKDTREAWPEFIEKFLSEYKIDQVYLFGDCRYYQRHTIGIAKALGIDVFVFEEGYIRPSYITFEKFGVNDFSHLSRNRDFYDALPMRDVPTAQEVRFSRFSMFASATIYYAVSNILFFLYPYYKHHRDFSAIKEAFFGFRSFVRKVLYKITERNVGKVICSELSKKYFFVPLQTYNDFQILEHSGYRSIEKFIIEVLESFAKHASSEHYLLFKHHPVDRGRKNYKQFIMEQASLLGVHNRIIAVHDVHTPLCLKHALGTVTVNSTVGLSSIHHGIPTITLGKALYDIPGLTNHGVPLAEFWTDQQAPDNELYLKYRHYLIEHTQLNGSFYGRMPEFV